jgi:glycosyltransferase involved in cell wall biosynthesis
MMIIHNYRPGSVGGAELQAERLAVRLCEMGHAMQVLTWLTVPDAPLEETCGGVRIHRTPHRLPYWVKHGNFETFRYLLRNRDSYDVLHAHMAFGHAVVATVLARCFRRKCIIKIACAGEYGDLYTFSKFEGFGMALRILHQADAIVAVSREVERELQEYGFPPERIMRIPNGVDTSFFRRTQPVQPCDKVSFVLIGRRHPQKGIDTTLHAVLRLKQEGLANRIEIKSYGADYPEYNYRAMAERLGVADLVEFRPFEKDIVSVYNAARCFLLPSRGEGLSNSLLEAMAMELPVIATPISGTPDVVDDGKDGVLIAPDSPRALAESMSKVVHRPDWARQLGLNARKKVENGFSLESTAQRYSCLYERLCGSRTRGVS